MPKWVVAILIAFGALGALSLFASVFIKGGHTSVRICHTYPVMQVDSPTGEYQVNVFNGSCSPKYELQTTVWLKRAGEDGGVSAFIAPSTQQREGFYSPLYLRFTWQDDSRLQISYLRGTKVESSAAGLNKTATLNGVAVSYTELARGDL